MIKFFLPVVPCPKKNSQQIFVNKKTMRPFITQSDRYKQFEKDCLMLIPCDIRKANISIPVTVKCVFYTKTKRKVDLNNLVAAMTDVLVKSGVLADDNRDICSSHDGSRVYHRPDNPGVEIEITRLHDYEQWKTKGESENV